VPTTESGHSTAQEPIWGKSFMHVPLFTITKQYKLLPAKDGDALKLWR